VERLRRTLKTRRTKRTTGHQNKKSQRGGLKRPGYHLIATFAIEQLLGNLQSGLESRKRKKSVEEMRREDEVPPQSIVKTE
jgi:hypothetical protein